MSLKERLSPERIEKIKKRLLLVDTLPAISSLVEKVLVMVEDDHTTIRDLERLIQLDQTVATRILKLINSPFYGFSDVTSLSRAIVLLGFHEVKNVVLGASIMSVVDARYTVAGMNMSDFWLHSVATGFISRLLARNLRTPIEKEAFTLGLLHDIGKVAYVQESPQLLEDLITLSQARDISFWEAEKLVGLSHSQLGWYIATKWNLPEPLCTSIRHHHEPESDPSLTMGSALVHVSDTIAVTVGVGKSGSSRPEPPSLAALDLLHLSPAMLDRIIQRIDEQRDQLVNLSKNLLPG